jgi:hypothetical protein
MGMADPQEEDFNRVGQGLGAVGLARFLVLAGAAPTAMGRVLQGESAWHDLETEWVSAAMQTTPPWWRVDLDQAALLAAQWDRQRVAPEALLDGVARSWQACAGDQGVRCLLVGGEASLDRTWLNRLLVAHAPLEATVFDAYCPAAAALDWPLHMGLPETTAGLALLGTLQDAWHGELFDAELARFDLTSDLMLYPGTLAEALSDGAVMNASAVIVLGHAGGLDRPLQDALLNAAETHQAAVVAVCGWAPDTWRDAVLHLVGELAHNTPLPLALFRVGRRIGPDTPAPDDAPPLVLGDLMFALENRPLDTAKRLAQVLRNDWTGHPLPLDVNPDALGHSAAAPDSAETVAASLEVTSADWPWQHETQGATRLARLRRTIEAQLGPLDLKRRPWSEQGMAMAAPPWADLEGSPPGDDAADGAAHAAAPQTHPAAPRETDPAAERHVQFDLFPSQPGAQRPPQPLLQADSDHRLEVFIAKREALAHGAAPHALDEHLLPQSRDGHTLTLVYCPLNPMVRDEHPAAVPPPATATLHLPRQGATARCTFLLQCGAQVLDFRARLLVLHDNRVLQSLILQPDTQGCLTLAVENLYAPGFESPGTAVPADMAFVVHHSPDGQPDLTTVSAERASFLEPAGLKDTIDNMRLILSTAVEAEAGEKSLRLDRPQTIDLMFQLAHYGAAILKEIGRQHPMAALEAATRVQVVEAVDKAYFPVEFLYAGPPPDDNPRLCPHALAALAPGGDAVHNQCAHRNDPAHVCPMSFWGFRKCIERHASNSDPAHVVSVPVPGRERLGPFRSALVAASARASEEMSGEHSLPAAVARHVADVTHVQTLDAWQLCVQAHDPDLLVLLPHSDRTKKISKMPILEFSDQELVITRLDRSFVHLGNDQGPLVLLLGCSTTLSSLPFLNFVRGFHLEGAPVVVGTLSVIHATQARLLAQRILDIGMGTARRLDETLLLVRRSLLAEGNGVAFTLMAYGHSSWQL